MLKVIVIGAEIMIDRGISVDYTTIYRWVMLYAPKLEQKDFVHSLFGIAI